MRRYAKTIGQSGKDHALPRVCGATGIYEARFMAAFVDDPAQVERGRRWIAGRPTSTAGRCATRSVSSLFDRTAHAWKKVRAWAGARAEFERRARSRWLWALSVHDKKAPTISSSPACR
jgi:hypothetical protein